MRERNDGQEGQGDGIIRTSCPNEALEERQNYGGIGEMPDTEKIAVKENTMKDLIVDENFPGLIDGGWCWKLSGSLVAEGSLKIKLNRLLIVGGGIKAGGGIEAGWRIEAGEGIKAGGGIIAGLAITCTKVLSFKFNLFAGAAQWKKPTPEESIISCLRIEGGGEVKHGIVKLLEVSK